MSGSTGRARSPTLTAEAPPGAAAGGAAQGAEEARPRIGFAAGDRLAAAILLSGLILAWEAAVRLGDVPNYILPPPSRIVATLYTRFDAIGPQALVTFFEILCGLAAGSLAGIAAALAMGRWAIVERAVGPLLVATQALPVFAIAPLLMVWFGFGLASKVVMSSIIIFFPVATSLMEGLRRTDRGLIELARLYRATPLQMLRLLRIPAALPSLAAGLRIAAALAPIGAVVGEWVGSSSGLGLLILQANARTQTDLVFAALLVLAVLSIALWMLVDRFTRRLVRWAPDTLR